VLRNASLLSGSRSRWPYTIRPAFQGLRIFRSPGLVGRTTRATPTQPARLFPPVPPKSRGPQKQRSALRLLFLPDQRSRIHLRPGGKHIALVTRSAGGADIVLYVVATARLSLHSTGRARCQVSGVVKSKESESASPPAQSPYRLWPGLPFASGRERRQSSRRKASCVQL